MLVLKKQVWRVVFICLLFCILKDNLFSEEEKRKLMIIPLHLLSRQVYGNMGSSVVQGSEVIEPEEWHHLAYRYDAQSKCTI